MYRPRAMFLMGAVNREEYVVDAHAVAEAILCRSERTNFSIVLEPLQSAANDSVAADQRQRAPRPDFA